MDVRSKNSESLLRGGFLCVNARSFELFKDEKGWWSRQDLNLRLRDINISQRVSTSPPDRKTHCASQQSGDEVV